MNQPAFIEHLLHQSDMSGPEVNTAFTPHCPEYPIDTIPQEKYDNNLVFKYTKLMQFLIGSINWLAISTGPDIATITNLYPNIWKTPEKAILSHQRE